MWFAHELKRLHDAGWTAQKISGLVGCTPEHIRGYLHLVERGEMRLIIGVERGLFPISFAIKVAEAGDSDMQRILMDAYDEGIVGIKTIQIIKTIIENRQRKQRKGSGKGKTDPLKNYSIKDLRADIKCTTEESDGYARQMEGKENRLLMILNDMNVLKGDAEIWSLLTSLGLERVPSLSQQYL